MGEVGAHLGDEVEGKGEGVEDGGDERGGAAEGLGDYDAVTVEDVVAVVANDEATARNGFGVCDHDDDGVLWVMDWKGRGWVLSVVRIHAAVRIRRRTREAKEGFYDLNLKLCTMYVVYERERKKDARQNQI